MPYNRYNCPSEFEVQKARKSKNKTFFFLAISVILLIGIILCLFFHNRGDKVSVVIDKSSIKMEESYGKYIITINGKITNNSSTDLEDIQLMIPLYDSEYNIVATAIDRQLKLKAGETWCFSAVGTSSTNLPVYYKSTDVTYR